MKKNAPTRAQCLRNLKRLLTEPGVFEDPGRRIVVSKAEDGWLKSFIKPMKNKRSNCHKTVVGYALTPELLAAQRKALRLTIQQLSARTNVPVGVVRRLEGGDLGSTKFRHLVALVRVLGLKLVFLPAREAQPMPRSKDEILAEFDRLRASGKCLHFMKNQPDQEYSQVAWDILGDPDTNRLFVVATNRKGKVRFGRVTDEPGGFAIKGQVFGIDAETNAVAEELSLKLFEEHRRELLAERSRR